MAPRNVGKSYATYEYILNTGGLTPERKALFLRNTDAQMKTMIADFKSRFSQFMVAGTMIYQKTYRTVVDKKTKEELIQEKKGELVGYFANVNNQHNFKSIEARDVKYIFYEEFNEDTSQARHMYFNFYNLIKTFSRFNDPEIILLGNKDAFRNDFFVHWNIEVSDNQDDDYIQEIRTDDGHLVGVWYDLHAKNFEGLKNNETTADLLASFDKKTRQFAQGGYKDPASKMVVNYKKLLPWFEPQVNLAYEDAIYCLGRIRDTNKYAIISDSCHKFETKKTLVLDINSVYLDGARMLDVEDIEEMRSMIFKLMYARRVYFDSYDTWELFKNNTVFCQAFMDSELM